MEEMVKYFLFIVAVVLAAAAAWAQGSPYNPAKMGITPQQTPQTVAVLDKNNVWVAMGTTTGGVFTPVGTSSGPGGSGLPCTCIPDGGQTIASVPTTGPIGLIVPGDATYATVWISNAAVTYTYSSTDPPTATNGSQIQNGGFIGLIGPAIAAFQMFSLGTGGVTSSARAEYFK